jgi:hypothetical protein
MHRLCYNCTHSAQGFAKLELRAALFEGDVARVLLAFVEKTPSVLPNACTLNHGVAIGAEIVLGGQSAAQRFMKWVKPAGKRQLPAIVFCNCKCCAFRSCAC